MHKIKVIAANERSTRINFDFNFLFVHSTKKLNEITDKYSNGINEKFVLNVLIDDVSEKSHLFLPSPHHYQHPHKSFHIL